MKGHILMNNEDFLLSNSTQFASSNNFIDVIQDDYDKKIACHSYVLLK